MTDPDLRGTDLGEPEGGVPAAAAHPDLAGSEAVTAEFAAVGPEAPGPRPDGDSDHPEDGDSGPDGDSGHGEDRPPTTLFQRLYTIHLPLLVIGIGVLISVGFIAADRWRRGMIAFGLVTLLAALLRLLLPEERVGQLAVRSRAFDVAFLGILGALVVWLAGSISPLGTG